MRRIVLCVAVSLDGFIEGPNGEYDWCFTDQDYGLTDFMKNVDGILMGRKSYEIALKHEEGSPWGTTKTYVFSKTMNNDPSRKHVEVVRAFDAIHDIRKQPGKDLWLFGGADLTAQFMNANMIDEYFLSIHPVVLGSGKPLFQNIDGRKWLKLIDTKAYDSGLINVRYTKSS